jgi:hypothetical protein
MNTRILAALIVSCLAAGCGKDSPSPTSPTPNAPTVSSVAVTGCQQAQGFQCVATATLSSGATQNVTASAQWTSTNIAVATINAAGVLAPLQSGQTDIRATYQGVSGTASLNVTINSQAATYTLQGVVSQSAPSTSTPVAGARVEVVDGPNAGRTVQTDGNGFYALTGLATGAFTLRTTHPDYQSTDRPVSVSRDTTLNVTLRPTPRQLDDTYTGQISGGESTTCSDGTFNKPCRRILLPIHNDGALSAEMDWVGGSADVDLSLWRGSTLIARAVGVGSREAITSNVVGGNTYELHVTYYSGANTVEYRVRVRRPN